MKLTHYPTLYISTPILAEATLTSWVTLSPGLAIPLTVPGFGLVGDGVRDALDTRLRDQ